MNHYQQSVRDWHIHMGLPAPDVPTPLPPDRAALRIRLLREEVEEFTEAAHAGDLLGTTHELCDVRVVTCGTAVEMGEALGCPLASLLYVRPWSPRALSDDGAKLASAWMRELIRQMERDDTPWIDCLERMYFVAASSCCDMGIDIRPFFDEVMAANFRKKGGPIRADGKIGRPASWQPADVAGIFRRLYGEVPTSPVKEAI